jgi:hypothetical protein
MTPAARTAPTKHPRIRTSAPCTEGGQRLPANLCRVPRLVSIAYLVIGVIVASQHSYYANLARLPQVLSAVVATALWPLLLLGANLHLSLAHL